MSLLSSLGPVLIVSETDEVSKLEDEESSPGRSKNGMLPAPF